MPCAQPRSFPLRFLAWLVVVDQFPASSLSIPSAAVLPTAARAVDCRLSSVSTQPADDMMRLGIAGTRAAASDDANPAAASAAAAADGGFQSDPLAAAAANADGAGAVTVAASPAGIRNGSKDESFFEARPWLDSDNEDDFYSVRGDFTPSRSSTPDHPRLITSFSGRMPADRPKPSLIRKKQRLLELLQEKQHYDDDDDSINDGGSDLENGDGAVHAEEYMKASRKGKKSQKSSRSACFPSLIWKHSFTSRRKERKEHNKDKVN